MALDTGDQHAFECDCFLSIAHHIRVLAILCDPDSEFRHELVQLADDLMSAVPGEARF
jgi:hypothetical protein